MDTDKKVREAALRMKAVRAAVGSTLRLMIDCNQGWRMPWDTEASWSYARAAEVAAALAPLDIEWLEEPLHRGDWQGLRRLRDTTPLRIAGGEMTRELHELRWLIEHGCFDGRPDDLVDGQVIHWGEGGVVHPRPRGGDPAQQGQRRPL